MDRRTVGIRRAPIPRCRDHVLGFGLTQRGQRIGAPYHLGQSLLRQLEPLRDLSHITHEVLPVRPRPATQSQRSQLRQPHPNTAAKPAPSSRSLPA